MIQIYTSKTCTEIKREKTGKREICTETDKINGERERETLTEFLDKRYKAVLVTEWQHGTLVGSDDGRQ